MTTIALASVVESLTQLAAPWKHFYDDSKVMETVVVFSHLAALFIGGGLALAADRATMQAARGPSDARGRQLVALGGIHRIVVPALALSFATGVLLFFTDVETFAVSITFWVKMGLVALLLANGLVMTRTETALRRAPDATTSPLWGRMRTTALASMALWLATLLAGVALTNI
jgi:uncharacterized membrane protein